jgi:uncharacterized Zn finger protein (UPF0148 family)
MRPAPQIVVPRYCPRCSGPLYRDYDGDYSCLMCGECTYLDASGAHGAIMASATEEPARKPAQRRKAPSAA